MESQLKQELSTEVTTKDYIYVFTHYAVAGKHYT